MRTASSWDGTFGLYLGWVAGALVALVAVVGLSAWFTTHLGPRPAMAGATVWGLLWLAQGRLAGEPRSYVVGVAAIVAAGAVTGLVVRGRARADRA